MQPSGRIPLGGQPPHPTGPNRTLSQEEDSLARAYLEQAFSQLGEAFRSVSLTSLERIRDGLDDTIKDVQSKLPPPSLEKLYQAIDEFAHSDRTSEWNIYLACPVNDRGNLAWRILALMKGIALKNGDKDPCIQALEKARKVPDQGKDPVLKALATLLFKNSEFTFDLTPFIPRLKEFLDKPSFSPTVLSFICCGLRNKCPTSKPEEELIDLLLKVFFQDPSNLRYLHHFDGLKINAISSQKLHRSAERLMMSRGSPYSIEYALLMLRLVPIPVFSHLLKYWLFAPYQKTESDRLIPHFRECRQVCLLEEALMHCSDPFFVAYAPFQRPEAIGEHTVQRFFKIGSSLMTYENWEQCFAETILFCIQKQREGYLSEEELKTLKIWISSHSQPIKLIKNLYLFPDIPQIWLWITATQSAKRTPINPDLFNTFAHLLLTWPDLTLPSHFTAPAGSERFPDVLKAICSRHFPDQVSMPSLDPEGILKNVINGEGISVRHGILLLYFNRHRPEFIAAVQKKLDFFLHCLLGTYGSAPDEVSMLAVFQQLEILYEAIKGKSMRSLPQETKDFLNAVLWQISINLNKCELKKRLNYQYILILGKFAEIPEFLESVKARTLTINSRNAIAAVRTYQEREAFLRAVYTIHKANPSLLPSDLQEFFKEPHNNQERFLGRELGYLQPRLNIARQLLDRQLTSHLNPSLDLHARRVKRQSP